MSNGQTEEVRQQSELSDDYASMLGLTEKQPVVQKQEPVKEETPAIPAVPDTPAAVPQPETEGNKDIPANTPQSGLLAKLKEFYPDATEESIVEAIKNQRSEVEELRHKSNLAAEIEPDLIRQNAFAKMTGIKNPELYEKVFSDLTQSSDIDVLMLGEKIRYYADLKKPMPASLEAELAEGFKKRFSLNETDDSEEPISEGKKELGSYNLRVEANAVRQNLSKITESVNNAVPTVENRRESLTLNAGKWDNASATFFSNPDFQKVSRSIPIRGIDGTIKDGSTLSIEYNIPPAEYTKELASFVQHAKDNGIEYNEGAAKNIATLIEMRTLYNNLPAILEKTATLAVENAHKEWVAKTTNTQKARETAPPVTHINPVSTGDLGTSDGMAKHLGLI